MTTPAERSGPGDNVRKPSEAPPFLARCSRAFLWTCLGFLVGLVISKTIGAEKHRDVRPSNHAAQNRFEITRPPQDGNVSGAPNLNLGKPGNSAASPHVEQKTSGRNNSIEAGRAFIATLRKRLSGDPIQYAFSLPTLLELDQSQALMLEAIAFESENEEDRLLAMRVLIARGGNDAMRFVRRFQDTNHRSNIERMTVARAIGLDDGALPKLAPLPLDAELSRRANQHIESSDAWDRVLGAGLLASQDGEEARTSLTHLAESDTDTRVRAAAIRSLGAVGTSETLHYLKQYFTVSPYPPAETDLEVLEALRFSTAKLTEKFRLTDR